MNQDRIREKLEDYKRALLRLNETLTANTTDPFVYDA